MIRESVFMLPLLMLASLQLLFFPSERCLGATSSGVSREIKIEHNDEISDKAIINLSGVEQNESLSDLELTKRLQTSGLFSKIHVHRTADAITITVEEKTTWFLVPYASFGEGSKLLGAAAGKASLFDQNGNVIGRAQIGTGNREASLIVRDEFLLNSLWIVGASLDFEDSLHYQYASRKIKQSTRNKYYGTSFQTGYHLSPFLTLSMNQYLETHQFETPNGRNQKGFQWSHQFVIDFGNFYVNEGLSQGHAVRTYFELSNPISDFHFYKYGVSSQLSAYLKGDFNWIIQPKFEIGNSLPYYQEFELGGSKLRSYPAQYFRSSSYEVVQNDLLLFSIPFQKFKLRPLVYGDVAFVEDHLITGIGFGMQLYLTKIAIPALEFFAGYGFNPHGFSTSVAIGPQF